MIDLSIVEIEYNDLIEQQINKYIEYIEQPMDGDTDIEHIQQLREVYEEYEEEQYDMYISDFIVYDMVVIHNSS